LALGPEFLPEAYPTLELYQEYANDPINYTGRMRLGLAWEGREMSRALKTQLNDVAFPFFLVHGTHDQVVPYSISEKLFEDSQTPLELKTFLPVPNSSHSLLEDPVAANMDIIGSMCNWMHTRLI